MNSSPSQEIIFLIFQFAHALNNFFLFSSKGFTFHFTLSWHFRVRGEQSGVKLDTHYSFVLEFNSVALIRLIAFYEKLSRSAPALDKCSLVQVSFSIVELNIHFCPSKVSLPPALGVVPSSALNNNNVVCNKFRDLFVREELRNPCLLLLARSTIWHDIRSSGYIVLLCFTFSSSSPWRDKILYVRANNNRYTEHDTRKQSERRTRARKKDAKLISSDDKVIRATILAWTCLVNNSAFSPRDVSLFDNLLLSISVRTLLIHIVPGLLSRIKHGDAVFIFISLHSRCEEYRNDVSKLSSYRRR